MLGLSGQDPDTFLENIDGIIKSIKEKTKSI
jgi:hypothetical protein